MFDDLRQRSAVSPFDEELPIEEEGRETAPAGKEKPLLGLTAMQRFVLALMLFLNVAVLGCLCLMATGAFNLPF